jgi:hypothetical protein
MATYTFLKRDENRHLPGGRKKVVIRSVQLGTAPPKDTAKQASQPAYSGLIAETQYSILSNNAAAYYKRHGFRLIRKKASLYAGAPIREYQVVAVPVKIHGAEKPYDYTCRFVVEFYCSSDALEKLGCKDKDSGFELTIGLEDLRKRFKVDNSSSSRLLLTEL